MLRERAAELNLPVTSDVVDMTDPEQIPLDNELDLATLVFVLSGIHPDKHVTAVKNLAKMLKPGGTVLFKDYAAYDHAMLRFKPGNKIQDRFYKRADLTRAFYFMREEVIDIFDEAGFRVVNCYYHHTYTENFKMEVHVERAFIQGVFVKK
uniref:Methyltransferase-like protein n=1 Tax=Panagrellus redivivus TaxID=6233 RepID=A0A7E4UWW6_PANRE